MVVRTALLGLPAVLGRREAGQLAGDANRVEAVRVLGEGLGGACGDGGLADAALLVADDDAAYDGGPPDRRRRVHLQPEADRLGETLDEGDAAVLGAGAEGLPLAGGQPGGERFGARGVDGGGGGSEGAPVRDALVDGVLNVDPQLGCADLQFLAEPRGSLETTFSRSLWDEGEVMRGTLLTFGGGCERHAWVLLTKWPGKRSGGPGYATGRPRTRRSEHPRGSPRRVRGRPGYVVSRPGPPGSPARSARVRPGTRASRPGRSGGCVPRARCPGGGSSRGR